MPLGYLASDKLAQCANSFGLKILHRNLDVINGAVNAGKMSLLLYRAYSSIV